MIKRQIERGVCSRGGKEKELQGGKEKVETGEENVEKEEAEMG